MSKLGCAVIFDSEKCTGCGLCVLACPFGVIWQGSELIHKCDLCSQRDVPACVVTCPTEALVFGDYESVAEVARKRAVQRMAKAIEASRGA